MNILVLNCGSSSLKYRLFDMASETETAQGLAERLGTAQSRLEHVAFPGTPGETRRVVEEPIADHAGAVALAFAHLTGPGGPVRQASDIGAVGHRVVHGGWRFSQPVVIDAVVEEGIREVIPLAPLHNPANLTGIAAARDRFPDAPHVAVFDTAFHQTMPEHAFLYALPYELYEKYGIRRYGFHGISHSYIAARAAEMLGRPLCECDLVTVHLGNGDSVCAVKKGQSVDTSMGMTPLAGTIMGTRSGDLDPEIGLFLERRAGMDEAAVDDLFNRKSGLFGICGSSDMRDIHRRREAGDARAELAFAMFAYSIRKYIGAYIAVLGRVDAVVFTAGIGEHDPATREAALEGLSERGIVLDLKRNRAALGRAMEIGREDAPVRVFAVPTNEELQIARQTLQTVNAPGAS
ncbi:acetate kinase [Desulfolutivibrio sulfoxidireducens]|uniref:acetate kinase n=1 Tax=Desulfolutivibrio sulfoxidireducens TaxID=2773299 RepID=UPI00159DB73B|nr:acetate kinase [Desulfolutivibrio sulfoxidireducens]QLA16591.1 acetate/propionate family kinase [Desulfolutivibrio sulfoxidireducens]QLA19527.1 acetate/propionate family kinase [Desulfolutivibrio sulfoxidireducens]